LRELVPGCPAALDALVSGCLAKDPARRLPDFSAVIAALEPSLAAVPAGGAQGGVSTKEIPPVDVSGPATTRETFPVETRQTVRPWQRQGRRGALVAAAVTTGAALGFAGWLALREPPRAIPGEPASASTKVVARPAVSSPAPAPAGPPAARPAPTLQVEAPRPSAPERSDPPKTEVRDRPLEVSREPAPAPLRQTQPATPAAAADPPAVPPAASASPPPSSAPAAAPEETAQQEEEKPRPMARGDFLTPGGGVVAPRLIRRAEPVYPRRALRQRVTARVVVAVLVDENGRVTRTTIKESDDPGLGFDEAAREAALKAVFEPPTRDGVPGKMWTELPFNFTLP
jgi:periplasmic protein TonB